MAPRGPSKNHKLLLTKEMLVGAVGIELLIELTKSHAFTVLPTANQMNWS